MNFVLGSEEMYLVQNL